MDLVLYHYTSWEFYNCIRNLGIIWVSDGAYGSGVYLTDIPPEHGRVKVVERLHGSQQDKFDMTEVCLETTSDALRLVRKVEAGPTHGIWTCPAQMPFASFKFVHFSRDESSWDKVLVTREIIPDHRTQGASKSPVGQLKELVERQNIVPRYVFTVNCNKFVCTAVCENKTAEGAGSSKKEAQNKAAIGIIRQLLRSSSHGR